MDAYCRKTWLLTWTTSSEIYCRYFLTFSAPTLETVNISGCVTRQTQLDVCSLNTIEILAILPYTLMQNSVKSIPSLQRGRVRGLEPLVKHMSLSRIAEGVYDS